MKQQVFILPLIFFKKLVKPLKYYKGIRQYDLIIYDDMFPNPMTGFRLAEFTGLLQYFKYSKIILNPTHAYRHMGFDLRGHFAHVKNFLLHHADLNAKLFAFDRFINLNTRLFYCVFLNNIVPYFDILEKQKINFAFTLYPGGGFYLNSPSVDERLKKIFSSPFFKGVIVNQRGIKEYLLEKQLCSTDKIHYIYGVPSTAKQNTSDNFNKTYYGTGKKFLDICFVAAKYSPTGSDKGYDLFIESAKILHKKYDNIRFHVIGGFSESDIDITALKNSIEFYGYINASSLKNILQDFDLIISPNKPFMLSTGSFDGFPLGSSIEASLAGCVMIATDELNQNDFYKNEEDIIIIKPSVESIISQVEYLYRNPERIKDIGTAGMKKTEELYSYKAQIVQRQIILSKMIDDIPVRNNIKTTSC